MADSDHPRLIIHNFLSPDSCKELEFIHKSSSTVGYRPNVFSTTLSHLIATNSAHLIMPFIPIRERLKEKIEEFLGCEYELFVEFTGLISWSKGDVSGGTVMITDLISDNGTLRYGVDFGGGLFHFQDAEPATFIPMTGDVLMYTADSRNVHSVDEITDGERLTLTLWFTRDRSHDEDFKLISFINRSPLSNSSRFDMYPMPASDNMYWFPPEQSSNCQSGFDLRCARLHVQGYNLYSSKVLNFSIHSSDYSEVLTAPLQLSRGNELFEKEFANVLHLLQVVHFYHWKHGELQESETKMETNNIVQLSESLQDKISGLKFVLLKDRGLAETVFRHTTSESKHQVFDWGTFSTAVRLWEAYTRKLIQDFLVHLPYWSAHHSLFSNPLLDLEEGI